MSDDVVQMSVDSHAADTALNSYGKRKSDEDDASSKGDGSESESGMYTVSLSIIPTDNGNTDDEESSEEQSDSSEKDDTSSEDDESEGGV